MCCLQLYPPNPQNLMAFVRNQMHAFFKQTDNKLPLTSCTVFNNMTVKTWQCMTHTRVRSEMQHVLPTAHSFFTTTAYKDTRILINRCGESRLRLVCKLSELLPVKTMCASAGASVALASLREHMAAFIELNESKDKSMTNILKKSFKVIKSDE